MKLPLILFLLLSAAAVGQKKNDQLITVHHAGKYPSINGKANDDCWATAEWHPLDQLWLGEPYTSADFSGRFKLAWSEKALLLLVEVHDDTLFDQYPDPLKLWWDDDCVEVFLDEDNSAGEHQYDYNAFAYHVALDYNVVDMDPSEKGRLYNDHIKVKRKTKGKTTIWEMAISIYDDSYNDNADNHPVTLSAGKEMGFALAYCDNDGSKERENFIGSVYIPGEDKNRGWIDAGVFGTIRLVE